MFKVISAEIKKILSKPSIYILAIILAAILVLGVFIFLNGAQMHRRIWRKWANWKDKRWAQSHRKEVVKGLQVVRLSILQSS